MSVSLETLKKSLFKVVASHSLEKNVSSNTVLPNNHLAKAPCTVLGPTGSPSQWLWAGVICLDGCWCVVAQTGMMLCSTGT